MNKPNQITGTTRPRSRYAEKKDVDFIKYVSFGLVVVLFTGFIGMFVAVAQMMIDSLRDRRDTNYQLQQKIDQQTQEIQLLRKTIDNTTE